MDSRSVLQPDVLPALDLHGDVQSVAAATSLGRLRDMA